jgi:hypothetical protein
MTGLEAASWSSSPGQTFIVTAFYHRKTADDGPVKVMLYLQKGFGAPTIADAQGFTCTTSYQASGWFPGWHITCTKPSITPNGAWFDAIQVKAMAPVAAGDYHVISGIVSATDPGLGPDDNRDYQKLHVN